MPSIVPPSTLESFTTFGDLLRFLRRRVGLTQMDLADEVGYSDAQISRLEQNQRLPDIPIIEARFVAALGIESEPETISMLLRLAAMVRREDAPAPGLCPYKGLEFFDEPDAALFVGREALTATLVENVLSLTGTADGDHDRFLAIVGASGSGKSSLVRAGLVPALRWNRHSADWRVHILTPTAHPLESLAEAIGRAGQPGSATTQLLDELTHDSRGLKVLARRQLGSDNDNRLLLVVDQFEELFALCNSERDREVFIGNLLTAASEPGGPVIVVLTLRADFYAHCASYARLRAALARNQQYIGSMTEEELRRAIEEPALRGGWKLEPGLVELLLHDVGREPGALPLLSHALLETWQRRRGRTMTLGGYASSRGVRGAIAETAETVFTDQFTREQQVIARRIFLRLTELSDETATADTRRRATFDELILSAEEADNTLAVIKALADARLITTREDSVEVAHEALIREWPTLRGWLEDNREALRLHRQLTEAAQGWLELGRSPDVLIRGDQLALASEWASEHGQELNALEREFLRASVENSQRELEEREAQRQRELETLRRLAESEKSRAEQQVRTADQLRKRALYLAGALVLAAIAALTAGLLGYRANSNLRRSEAQRLAAEANSLIQSAADPQLIALLSIRSITTEYTPEGDTALHGASRLALPLKAFVTPDGPVYSTAISPDGRYVLTVSTDLVQLWDVETGQEARRFASDIAPIRATFSRDGDYVLVSGLDAVAYLYNTETGRLGQSFLGHEGPVVTGDISRDGRYVVTGSLDDMAILWDAGTGEEIRRFIGHTEDVEWVEFSPDGELLLTAGLDGTARLWRVESGEELHTLSGHTMEIPSAGFSPDGRTIATASHDKSARIWDVLTGMELRQFTGHGNRVNSVAFSPDGHTLLTGSDDKTMRLWDVQSGRELQRFGGHSASILEVAYSLDGRFFLSGSLDGSAWLWDAHQALGEHPPILHDSGVSRVAFSPDGRYLATAGEDGLARLWDARTGQAIREFAGHSRPIYTIEFSADGRHMLSGSFDGTARLWDVQTGETVQAFIGQDVGTSTVVAAYLPDGESALTATWDGEVRLWDLNTGALRTSFVAGPGEINGLAGLPDSQAILGGSHDGMVRLWELETGRLLKEFAGHTDIVNGVRVSPDGQHALSFGFDKVARLWDLRTGQEIQELASNTGPLYGVAFSPNEPVALTASGDNTARLWDLTTGKELRRFTGHTDAVGWVEFSPDGRLLATASSDGTVRLWNTDYRETIRYLCSHVGRDFSDAERKRFGIPDTEPTCRNW